MKISYSAVLCSLLFPAMALAQAPVPAVTTTPDAVVAPVIPVAVPAVEAKKDGVTFKWTINGSLKYYLTTSTKKTGMYLAYPVGEDDDVDIHKATLDNPKYGWSRSNLCSAVVDCISQGNSFILATKATAGKLTLDVKIPLIQAGVWAAANDLPKTWQERPSLVDAIVRRTSVTAEYKDGPFYGKVGTRLGNGGIPYNLYAGIKAPTSVGELDVRMGRWIETVLQIPYGAFGNDGTVGNVGQSTDVFFLNGVRAQFEAKIGDNKITPSVAYMNNIEYDNNQWRNIAFDQRVALFGLAGEFPVSKVSIKPSFYMLKGKHVWTDGGVKADPLGATPELKAGTNPQAKAVAPIAIWEAKLGVDVLEGAANLTAHYYSSAISDGNVVDSAVGGNVVSGAKIGGSGSKMNRMGVDVYADSTLVESMKNLGTEGGKILVALNATNWAFGSKVTDAATGENLTDNNEIDSVVSLGYGNESTTVKLNWERWATKKPTYIVDTKDAKTTKWNAIYLSTDFTL